MKVWPLQFRTLRGGEMLFSDDSGAFFRSSETFLDRYGEDTLTEDDRAFLRRNGHAFEDEQDAAFVAFASRWSRRIAPINELSYVILVPTLRCNLLCDYCQVSRVAEAAKGFDWSERTLDEAIAFFDGLETRAIKVEFQGGEPLLRLDLLDAVRTFCRDRFEAAEFVVCTNLQDVSEDAWRFLAAEDTHLSTSLDGTDALHQRQRTKTEAAHRSFARNLDRALSQLGAERVSALPTIDPDNTADLEEIIANFAARGLRSIYLRRVNYQGFARKRYGLDSSLPKWLGYYRRFIEALIRNNRTAAEPMEEYYFSHLLRRILQGGHHNHVDLRNPNWLGHDYVVVDFDGKLYPTDEARMVSRVGQVDLSIGTLSAGIDRNKTAALNQHVCNFDDPDCMDCAYKPYCGIDIVDDLSRYGRIDLPRHQTDHCQYHLGLFDLAFELIYSTDTDVRRSLAAWLGVPHFSTELAPRHI